MPPSAHPASMAPPAPRLTARCAWQVVGDEAVLLDLEGRTLAGLNAAGSFLLPLIDGRRGLAALVAALGERFGLETARAEADVRAFLADLARRGFVEELEG